MVGIYKSAFRPCMDEVNGVLRLRKISAGTEDLAEEKVNDNNYIDYSTIDEMFDSFKSDNRVVTQFMCRTCDIVYRIVEAYRNKNNAYIMEHTEYHKDLLELAYRWYAWKTLSLFRIVCFLTQQYKYTFHKSRMQYKNTTLKM